MKISQLNTDNGLDVLCEIVPYIGNIIEDEKLTAELRRKTALEPSASMAEVYAAGIDKLAKIVPVVLKTHRSDVYAIVAAINGKTPEDIAKQNFLKTAADIRDIVQDKEFRDFFKSWRLTDAT